MLEKKPWVVTGPHVAQARDATSPLGVVLRWRRFLLLATAVSWAAILVGGLIWPPRVVCEATLALPNAGVAAEDEKQIRTGIPLAMYKELRASLSDLERLRATFGTDLSARKIEYVRTNLDGIVRPSTTGPRDEMTRTERQDRITAARFTFSDRAAARAELVVERLAGLLRHDLVVLIAQERIDAIVLRATTAVKSQATTREALTAENGSLRVLAGDLQELQSTMPSRSDGPREVVDVREGGYRYLPVGVQILGVRARLAENDHALRQAGWWLRVHGLRLAVFGRLAQQLREGLSVAPTKDVRETPARIRAAAEESLAKELGSEAAYVRAEVNELDAALRSHIATIGFIQTPSLRVLPRLPWVIAALLASALALPLGVFLVESLKGIPEGRERG